MSNNPRNPLPGDQPGQPQDPRQGMDPSREQMPGQPASGQPSGQQSGQQQPDVGRTPASGTNRSTGSSASGATPASSSEQRTGYTEPRAQQTTTTRTQQPPRRSNSNKKIALFSILGLAAVAGIITGFAASNSSNTPTAAAVHRTVPRTVPSRSIRVLTLFNGSGSRTSSSFTLTNPSAAHWGFNCASGTHSFRASIATTSGGNRMTIANTSGTRSTGTVIMHPTSPGTAYRITANSACPYSIRIYGT
jgi:hypothetical protein